MTLSPRLPAALVRDTAHSDTAHSDTAHSDTGESGPTNAELNHMTQLALRRGARRIAIGRGRTQAAATAATALIRRWEAVGGTVTDVVTWPEQAASWLRHATRFAAADPDLWIMTGPPRGWAQMTRRLLWSTPWQSGRTLALAELGTHPAVALVGAHNLHGLAGPTADGRTWTVCNGNIHVTPQNTATAK